ncbi:MAG: DUF1343 domain-containing protein [Chlorobiales bacterium]|nr:DUF1343 domain-containing protein [Chlorobiales bacterium]
MTRLLRIASIILLILFSTGRLYAAGFRYGIDVLDNDGCRMLSGKRVGLVTNAAARSADGTPGYRLLLRHGVNLRFLMAPEHGFSLDREAGEKVGNAALVDTLKVYSLYGDSRKPDPSLLNEIDVLVFDLQDVGVRCYTYISTMKLCMEACREAGITFMVLDRPNPLAPLPADGFVLKPAFESFVGAAELPFVHGLTVGEIAVWLQRTRYSGLSLKVVKMDGYRRSKFADEFDGFRFIPPSPNLRDFETVMLYPSTVMLEATDVSEGRGTDAPFRMIGAPFIDGAALKKELNVHRLPGVDVMPVVFTPVSGKHVGLECRGVRLKITDRRSFDPFRTSVALLLSLRKLYPQELGLSRHARFFDQLAGSSRYRNMIEDGRSIGEILEAARSEVREFESASSDRFLYP